MSIIHSEATASIALEIVIVKPSKWQKMTEEQKERRRKYIAEWKAARPGYGAAATKKCRDKNPEKTKAQAKAWRDANPDKMHKFKRAWEKKNPDKVKAQQKRHREYQKETIKLRNRKYQRANKDKVKGWAKKSYDLNLESRREYYRILSQNRRQKMASGEGLSHGLRQKLIVQQNYKCVYCPADLRVVKNHLDHIISLDKGGPHCDSNMQCLCAPCNLSKSNRDLEDWLKIREQRAV